MAKANSILLLVGSLTKGEKRYFKMFTGLQKGSKDYLTLFDIIEKGHAAEEVKKLFRSKCAGASYETTVKYLFKVITDCLLHIRIDQDKTAKQVTALLKVNILFEKSLYDLGFRQLRNIQASATLYEQNFLKLWSFRLELQYIQSLEFTAISENELIQKQARIQEVLKQEKNITQRSALYELLQHRQLFKGPVRNKKQKDELDDLVIAELSLANSSIAETFESSKTHLLFQAGYFIAVSDYKSAMKTFYELNELFEENAYIWKDSPYDYLSSIEGILDSLHTIKQYREMEFFFGKLKKLGKTSVYLEVRIQSILFIYKSAALIDAGKIEKANTLKNSFDKSLFRHIHILDFSKQAVVFMYTSLIYMGMGNFNRAHFYLNQILLESKLYNDFPLFRTFRLLHVLVHYELGNHDYIGSEIRSIKRGLNGNPQKSYQVEKIIFNFVQYSGTFGLSERTKLWVKLSAKFEEIQNDKFEIQIMKIFDFSLWIKASLLKKSFKTLLKEKFQNKI